MFEMGVDWIEEEARACLYNIFIIYSNNIQEKGEGM
jgi:hypothetical protein